MVQFCFTPIYFVSKDVARGVFSTLSIIYDGTIFQIKVTALEEFLTHRSSHRRCFVKKDVLRNFAKFTGKQPCQSLYFNKVAGLRPATLLKKRLWHSCFPVNFAKFLRTPFLQNSSRRLLLNQFQQSDAFHIETSYLICNANQMAGSYMKCNTELKWVNASMIDAFETVKNIFKAFHSVQTVIRGCSSKQVFLKNSQISQCWSLFLIRLQVLVQHLFFMTQLSFDCLETAKHFIILLYTFCDVFPGRCRLFPLKEK